jgi:hypothetical protein
MSNFFLNPDSGPRYICVNEVSKAVILLKYYESFKSLDDDDDNNNNNNNRIFK